VGALTPARGNMLYQIYEMQHRVLQPLNAMAQEASRLFGSPASPFFYTPLSRNLWAYYDLVSRVTQRYIKPEFNLAKVTIAGQEYPIRETPVLERPFCRLIRFERVGAPRATPVIVFAPLSGHFATLLRDTVKSLLADHDVYVTDWVDAREVSATVGGFSFDDYVRYVREFILHLGPEVHAVSVCQPTVPVLAAVSLMAAAGEKTPRSLTLMGGPIDTRRSPTEVNGFAAQHDMAWFEQNVIHRVPVHYPGFMRRVYPGFLQLAGFIAMNPDRHFESHYNYYLHLVNGDGESASAHRRFYDEYNAVMDLPAEYYLDTIQRVFREFQLPRGVMRVEGETVNPAAIQKTALLTIEGELDDISGNGQTEAAQGLCSGIPTTKKQHYFVPGVGHYGIFSGRKWRENIYPVVRDFIREHRKA
jgi:poly(3-hydroxybutyrate) depolymerase